jgi:L-amino acid N-acyltransferase
MQIRAAAVADLPAMLDIYNHIIAHTTAVWHYEPHTLAMRQDWFRQRQQDGYPVYVAQIQGTIAGFCTYGAFRPWPGYRYTVENSVYVAEGYRGRGVAVQLMEVLIAHAKKNGVHAMVAGIEAQNSTSIALHQKFGFEEVAHFKEVGWKFDRWLDLKFLQLNFDGPNPV